MVRETGSVVVIEFVDREATPLEREPASAFAREFIEAYRRANHGTS